MSRVPCVYFTSVFLSDMCQVLMFFLNFAPVDGIFPLVFE